MDLFWAITVGVKELEASFEFILEISTKDFSLFSYLKQFEISASILDGNYIFSLNYRIEKM